MSGNLRIPRRAIGSTRINLPEKLCSRTLKHSGRMIGNRYSSCIVRDLVSEIEESCDSRTLFLHRRPCEEVDMLLRSLHAYPWTTEDLLKAVLPLAWRTHEYMGSEELKIVEEEEAS